MKTILVACLAVAPSILHAQDLESMQKAGALGNLLASEAYCGLSFDQAAIGDWIDANTDPADMGFASSLDMMTSGAAFSLEGQSESQKTAHCRSVERTARHYGFIK